ncbi:MAG TPA: hypothetical protein VFE62_15825 [Gemmataceae bacterium]|nr:hypothetical protein [Gemmataceae bacterium]
MSDAQKHEQAKQADKQPATPEMQGSLNEPEQMSEFEKKEYEKLRDEIKYRVEETFKVETGALAAVLGVGGWLLQYHPSTNWLYFLPLVLWIVGGLAIWSKGRHLNRMAAYISLHYEGRFGHTLLGKSDSPLTSASASGSDRLINKGAEFTPADVLRAANGTNAPIIGGWETWLFAHSYNYTIFQIAAWVIVCCFAILVPFVGFGLSAEEKAKANPVIDVRLLQDQPALQKK